MVLLMDMFIYAAVVKKSMRVIEKDFLKNKANKQIKHDSLKCRKLACH